MNGFGSLSRPFQARFVTYAESSHEVPSPTMTSLMLSPPFGLPNESLAVLRGLFLTDHRWTVTG